MLFRIFSTLKLCLSTGPLDKDKASQVRSVCKIRPLKMTIPISLGRQQEVVKALTF